MSVSGISLQAKNVSSSEIFLSRLYEGGLPRNIQILTPSNFSKALGINLRRDKSVILARVDGVYYYKMTYKNLRNFYRQRESNPRLPNALLKLADSYPLLFSRFFNYRLNLPIIQLLKRSDGVIFQSEISKEMYRTFVGDFVQHMPSTTILNGVDLTLFSPRNSAKLEGTPALIISASKYRLHKRLKQAIELTNSLLTYFPRIKLHVLGELDILVQESLKNQDVSNCRFHQKVPPEDLPAYYSGADIQLSLCIFDACPNVVAEGLACGLPVVTPVESGAAELIGSQNAAWAIRENLKMDYYELHNDLSIPGLPIQRYRDTIIEIFDSLKTAKEKARFQAESQLDIKITARRYLEFSQELEKKHLNYRQPY